MKAASLSPLVAHAPLLVANGKTVRAPQSRALSASLDLEAYRRWSAASSLFASVCRTAITGTRVRNGVIYYTVKVFLSLPSSRLPTNDSDAATSEQSLVRQVEWRYSDFEQLRRKVLGLVAALPRCRCSYCADLLVFLRFAWNQPGGLTKLARNPKRRMRMLDAFLSELTKLAQAPAIKFEHRNGRHANRERVQQILEAFLLNGGSMRCI